MSYYAELSRGNPSAPEPASGDSASPDDRNSRASEPIFRPNVQYLEHEHKKFNLRSGSKPAGFPLFRGNIQKG